MPPSLPTREEINPVHDDLDGQVACEHFFGKTVEEAEALFRESPLYFDEDLFWMGPIAFRFYVQAAIRFIQSDDVAFQAGFINGIRSTLERHLECDPPEELIPVAGQLAAVCSYIVEHWSKFGANEEIYGDLQLRYVALQRKFEHLSGGIKNTSLLTTDQ
jgi:hypothetical protein